MLNNALAKLRGKIQQYPIFSALLSAGVAYYGSQYGPAIRAVIRLISPSVGLKCE